MLIIFIQEKLYGFPLFFLDNTKHTFSIIHGPQFYPFAVLPVDDLMCAWNATNLGCATCAYTLRGDFREERQVSTDDMLKDTLETHGWAFRGAGGDRRQDRGVCVGNIASPSTAFRSLDFKANMVFRVGSIESTFLPVHIEQPENATIKGRYI